MASSQDTKLNELIINQTTEELLQTQEIKPNQIYVTPDEEESFVEQDPTVPQHVKNITQADITKWNNPEIPEIDTSDFVTLTDNQTIGGIKGFLNPVKFYGVKQENGNWVQDTSNPVLTVGNYWDSAELRTSGNLLKIVPGGQTHAWWVSTNSIYNSYDSTLGTSTHPIKTLYLSSQLSDGTNAITVKQIVDGINNVPEIDTSNLVDKSTDQEVGGNKTFTGATTLNNTTISGNLTINGNIYQNDPNGKVYSVAAEELKVEDDYIILRNGAESQIPDLSYSGLEFHNYGLDASGAITSGRLVIDNKGILRVGDVGDEQPLATRIETPTANGIAIWDDTNKRFKTDEGITADKADSVTTRIKLSGRGMEVGSSQITEVTSRNISLSYDGNFTSSGVAVQPKPRTYVSYNGISSKPYRLNSGTVEYYYSGINEYNVYYSSDDPNSASYYGDMRNNLYACAMDNEGIYIHGSKIWLDTGENFNNYNNRKLKWENKVIATSDDLSNYLPLNGGNINGAFILNDTNWTSGSSATEFALRANGTDVFKISKYGQATFRGVGAASNMAFQIGNGTKYAEFNTSGSKGFFSLYDASTTTPVENIRLDASNNSIKIGGCTVSYNSTNKSLEFSF